MPRAQPDRLRQLVDAILAALAAGLEGTALADHYTCLADALSLSRGEEHNLEGLAAGVAPAPVVRVPVQPFEVSDLDSLTALGELLFAE